MRIVGTENELNYILSIYGDSEDEIENLSTSNYLAMAEIPSIFQTRQSDLVITTLNIQMRSLIIFMQLWIICLHLDTILGLFGFRKLGWHLMLAWRYLKYPVLNWYTRVQGVSDMGA